MRRTRSVPLLLAAAALATVATLAPCAALADSAVVSPDGTLYEVFATRYGEVIPTPGGSPDAEIPVLALRVSRAGQPATLELVEGTVDASHEGSISVELEDSTATLFVAYTKSRGLMTDMHVALRRGTVWSGQDILSNRGYYYLSVNPKVTVTRQRYVTFDAAGAPVTRTRSVFSLVGWEESGPVQARYAPIFVEDGSLRVESVAAWNLNELAGAAGPTDASGRPLSSYSFPSVQADPTTNGGVLATFANLATGEQQVLGITFPDDLTKLAPPGATRITDEEWSRAHVPIGRSAGKGRIPADLDTDAEVGATISQSGVTTFYWLSEGTMSFLRSDDAPESAPRRIGLREDLTAERALRLVKALAEKN